MRKMKAIGGLLLAATFATTGALAETYNYELDIAYQSTQFDASQTIITAGGSVFSSSDTDTDVLSLSGSWFFSGLTDDNGPRARAALIDRASSLNVGYGRTDQTTSVFFDSTDPAIIFPSIDSRFGSDGDSFGIDLRYVDRDSGWFGSVGLIDTDVSFSGAVGGSVDATGWSLGVGKYLFDTTTLGVSVSEVDGDTGADATVVSIAFEHLAGLGDTWQFAVDLRYDRADPEFSSEIDTLAAAISLYPTADFEFGIRIADTDGGFGQSSSSVEGFASWFVKPNIRLAAGYRVDDVDFAGFAFINGSAQSSDADQDSFGISASIRF